MFKPNIGIISAMLRITCGLTLLSWGTAKLTRRSYSGIPFFTIIIGAMKVAEGITRFCPLVFVYKQKHDEDFYEQKAKTPMNPS